MYAFINTQLIKCLLNVSCISSMPFIKHVTVSEKLFKFFHKCILEYAHGGIIGDS